MKVLEVIKMDGRVFALVRHEQAKYVVVHVKPDMTYTWSYMDKGLGGVQFTAIARYLRGPATRLSPADEKDIERDIEDMLISALKHGLPVSHVR